MADGQAGAPETGTTTWLSQGFEKLLCDLARPSPPFDYPFDVVIVGSGYGGAVAAAELAGCTKADGTKVSVCVLERGKEYLPGMFPAFAPDLANHIRFTSPAGNVRGMREGLFDVRVGRHVNALVANGLGGGSLINAGVMARPRPEALKDWPGDLSTELFRPGSYGKDYFDRAAERLGAVKPYEGRPCNEWPAKLRALRRLEPDMQHAAITVGAVDPNDPSAPLQKCIGCGDCATGCNHGAKNSVDVSLLERAFAAGARIVTGATVLRVERGANAGLWQLHTVHTEERLRTRQGAPFTILARKVILAAGTFGSTEILLRSESDALRFSALLGRRFSANGDTIAAIYGGDREVNAVAHESRDPALREVGPSITGIVDLRDEWLGGITVEEIAIPAALRRACEEVITTANSLHELSTIDCSSHGPGRPDQDPCAVDASAIHNTSFLVMMGDDGAQGVIALAERTTPPDGDGGITVKWPELPSLPLFGRQLEVLQRLVMASGTAGRIVPNPVWRPFPESMRGLFDYESGPALTVHPLGGCSIGLDADDGVVNDLGQVFEVASATAGSTTLADLIVLDGSIVRNALGINPALTIAAVALRAVERLIDHVWHFARPSPASARQRKRPRFRPAPGATAIASTRIEIIERMSGEVGLPDKDGKSIPCRVELTLPFKPQSIDALVLPSGRSGRVSMARTLCVGDARLRVFTKRVWDAWRASGQPSSALDELVELSAPLGGSLTLLERESSWSWGRIWRALVGAWFLNRGMRDMWQAVWPKDYERRLRKPEDPRQGLWQTIMGGLALASRAGEVRLLQYDLQLTEKATASGHAQIDTGPFDKQAVIRGLKRLTYARRSNPWRQLMRMQVQEVCGHKGRRGEALELDTRYLSEIGVPLFRIASQADQVSALLDVASFLAYFMRLVFNVHAWSFRKPDIAPPRRVDRLPQGIPGRLPAPECFDIPVANPVQEGRVIVRLTRYRPSEVRGAPLVMIPGYSTSGTTFAHHSVDPNMAEYFFHRGRDVWLVDLRTSSGLPTATHPWTFEEVARADIPAAVAKVCAVTRAEQVDMFAHCMGSAMFSMAVLSAPTSGAFEADRQALPLRIRRAVLSQIAPAVVMSPANVFRGYAMSYLRHFLPLEGYRFEVSDNPSLGEQLLDRLLATLPYPEEEFDAENPPWPPCRRTPFVGTRHRMDALYGRDFRLVDEHGRRRLSDASLECIDDLFGPLSIDTVSQVIHFARTEVITNRQGRNVFVQPPRITTGWKFPTMSIHGTENDLADIATLERFRTTFLNDAGITIRTQRIEGFGHQDCLLGVDAARAVFDKVAEFLERQDA